MAMEQPATLRVVTAKGVVEAEWMPSGVAGLALVGRPLTTGWRLVHMTSGRAVSRSAEHSDPEAVRDLASRIAPLTDWTEPNVAVSVPRLRQELDRVITAWQAAHRVGYEAPSPPLPRPGTTSERDLAVDLETLAAHLRAAEHERLLLRETVRRLHRALAPAAFNDSLATLSQDDRDFVRSMVNDESIEDATGVVQAIRRSDDALGPRPADRSSRVPARARTGRFDGPDAAAS
jgi:hypothetical protein